MNDELIEKLAIVDELSKAYQRIASTNKGDDYTQEAYKSCKTILTKLDEVVVKL